MITGRQFGFTLRHPAPATHLPSAPVHTPFGPEVWVESDVKRWVKKVVHEVEAQVEETTHDVDANKPDTLSVAILVSTSRSLPNVERSVSDPT